MDEKLTFTIKKTPDNYDSDNILCNGRGIGFIGRSNGDIGLTRCPVCGRENYAHCVLIGICSWCGFDLKKEMGKDEKQNSRCDQEA
jgi:ribosomal protein L37E